jgi:hypothetical protein
MWHAKSYESGIGKIKWDTSLRFYWQWDAMMDDLMRNSRCMRCWDLLRTDPVWMALSPKFYEFDDKFYRFSLDSS